MRHKKKRDEAQKKRKEEAQLKDEALENREKSRKKGEKTSNCYFARKKRNKEILELEKKAQDQEDNSQKCKKEADDLEEAARILEIKANEIEKIALNNDDKSIKRYRAALNREKSATNLVSEVKRLNESIEKSLNTLNDINKTLKKLLDYKKEVLSKQKKCFWSIVFLLLGLFLTVGLALSITAGYTIGNFSLEILGKIRLLFALGFLLLFVVLIIYSIYSTSIRYLHYNNAINKIDVLRLRLELYTDKDLVTPYRINREIEMIYSILES